MEKSKILEKNNSSPREIIKPLEKKVTQNNKTNYDKYLEEKKRKKQNFKRILKEKKKLEKKEAISEDLILKKQKQNDPERKNKVKRLFFGVGKEFWRVTWPKKMEMFNNFITVAIITLVLAGILTGITFLITNFVN